MMLRPQSLETVHTHTHTHTLYLLMAKKSKNLVLINVKIKNNILGNFVYFYNKSTEIIVDFCCGIKRYIVEQQNNRVGEF